MESKPYSYATRQQVLQVIKESGLYEPLGPAWDKFSLDAPELSYAELRQQAGALSPPLSETTSKIVGRLLAAAATEGLATHNLNQHA